MNFSSLGQGGAHAPNDTPPWTHLINLPITIIHTNRMLVMYEHEDVDSNDELRVEHRTDKHKLGQWLSVQRTFQHISADISLLPHCIRRMAP